MHILRPPRSTLILQQLPSICSIASNRSKPGLPSPASARAINSTEVISNNLAEVCNYLESLKTYAVANVLVSNLLNVALAVTLICREGIAVFHNELTATHKTKAWTAFVTELILNLIERYRKRL